MGQYCRKIKDDFKQYTKILDGLKISVHPQVSLNEGRAGHRKWLLGKSSIKFVLNNKGHIQIRQSKSLLVDYGFQVFVESIDKPILRFDADGATHYNNEDQTLTLLEREIKTPHFHKFDKNGKEFAYRTPAIDENEYEIQKDIEVGMHYFCEENYIQTSTGLPLQITGQKEIFPEDVTFDVHKGIVFL